MDLRVDSEHGPEQVTDVLSYEEFTHAYAELLATLPSLAFGENALANTNACKVEIAFLFKQNPQALQRYLRESQENYTPTG